MLSVIRKWFTQEIEIIPIKKLSQLIKNMRSTEEQNMLSKASAHIEAIRKNLFRLQQQSEDLAHAKIPDEKHVEGRIKTIVKSQQAFFVSQVTMLVKQITFPKELTAHIVKEWVVSFHKEYVTFTQRTIKSFSVSYHLFYEQLDDIKETLRTLDELQTELNSLLCQEKDLLGELLSMIAAIDLREIAAQEDMKLQTELRKQIMEIEKRLSHTKQLLEELQRDIMYTTLFNELHIVEDREKLLAMSIMSFFSQTKRQWLKLAKRYPDAGIIDMLNDFAKEDTKEEFTKRNYPAAHKLLLSAIEKKELGNEEYEKLLRKVTEWTPTYLNTVLSELTIIKKRKGKITETISPSNEKIDTLKNMFASLEREYRTLQSQIKEERIKEPINKKKLSELASAVLGKQVAIGD